MATNMTSFIQAFKELYSKEAVQDLTYKDRPTLAMLKKELGFGGSEFVFDVLYGNPQSRSASISRAITQSRRTSAVPDSSRIAKFRLTRAKDYGILAIDRETMLASEGAEAAFLAAKKTEMDGILNSLGNSASQALFGNGFGSIGRVSNSSFATTTLTLTVPDQVVNFEVGMELVVAAAEDTGNIRAVGTSTNGLFIVGVDRIAGTVTTNANLNDATNGIPTIAQNDFIFARGDRLESGTITAQKMVGLAGWVPGTAPTSALFFGVDRTVDSVRLAGSRYSAANQPIEEAFIDALRQGARDGASPTNIVCSFDRYADLEKSLGTRVVYCNTTVGRVSFRGIEFIGPKGTLQVYPDKDCPVTNSWAFDKEVLKLKTLTSFPEVFDNDQELMRIEGLDSYEIRAGYYGNYYTSAPGRHINVVHV
jgi:hypothetical protein